MCVNIPCPLLAVFLLSQTDSLYTDTLHGTRVGYQAQVWPSAAAVVVVGAFQHCCCGDTLVPRPRTYIFGESLGCVKRCQLAAEHSCCSGMALSAVTMGSLSIIGLPNPTHGKQVCQRTSGGRGIRRNDR